MWVAYSFGAMGFLAAMTLMFVPPGVAGVQPSIVLFYLFVIGGLFNFSYLTFQRTSLHVPRSVMLWIVGAARGQFSRQSMRLESD